MMTILMSTNVQQQFYQNLNRAQMTTMVQNVIGRRYRLVRRSSAAMTDDALPLLLPLLLSIIIFLFISLSVCLTHHHHTYADDQPQIHLSNVQVINSITNEGTHNNLQLILLLAFSTVSHHHNHPPTQSTTRRCC